MARQSHAFVISLKALWLAVALELVSGDMAVMPVANELDGRFHHHQYETWSDRAAALAEAEEPLLAGHKVKVEAELTTRRPKRMRTVLPGPKCYFCDRDCREDFTSDTLKTCTADQICVRKLTQIKSDDGHLRIDRSSGCTYECKIGFLISDSYNLTTKCCESYQDTACIIPEYTAAIAQRSYALPKSTIVVICLINLIVGYFF